MTEQSPDENLQYSSAIRPTRDLMQILRVGEDSSVASSNATMPMNFLANSSINFNNKNGKEQIYKYTNTRDF